MNIKEKKNHRLIYAGLWLPVLLTPIAYMFLAYVGEGAFRRNGFWHFAGFIFPFCVLFCIHHFLLVRKLFMRNRLKAYFIAVVCLLGTFVIVNNLGIIHSLHPQIEKGVERDMRHVPEHSGDFRRTPPHGKDRKEKNCKTKDRVSTVPHPWLWTSALPCC